MKTLLKKISTCFLGVIFISMCSCSSVFSGGTGGIVVDAESMSNPKAGIANVDVYAYTSKKDRDSDYNRWNKDLPTKNFVPYADYYGHTTTGTDGSWNISKLVWKEKKPDFGKDADYTTVYLIFYHADYGCTTSETIVMSDSFSDCTYTELTSVVKRTNLRLNFIDVATEKQTEQSVYVEVFVPQKTDSDDSEDKLYTATIIGNGNINIRYPRYLNDNGIPTYTKTGRENFPSVKINYYQARENSEIEWKGCKADYESGDFSFDTERLGCGKKGIEKTIGNEDFSLTFYGKRTKIYMPDFSGTYGNTENAESDGIHILLKGKDSLENYSVLLGDTYTVAQNRGSNGAQTHGVFSGLGGNSYFWIDNEYTGRFSEYLVKFVLENGTVIKELSVKSDKNSYELVL